MSDNKRLAGNIGAMGVLRFSQFLIPLVTMPYLARVIGVANMGKVAAAQAILLYLSTISELGMSLYAPREIAVNRHDRRKIDILSTNIFALKLITLAASYLVFLVCLFSIPKLRAEKALFFYTSLAMIPWALLPAWFFQGIEKLWEISLSSTIGSVVNAAGIFIFIRHRSDYALVPLIFSLSLYLPLIRSIYMLRKYGYALWLSGAASFSEMRRLARESFPLFLSNVSWFLYMRLYTPLLSFLTDDITVGYYACAEKLIIAGLQLMGIIGTVFYPHISRVIALRRQDYRRELKKVIGANAIFALSAWTATFFGAKTIIALIYGPEFGPAVITLKIFSFAFLISAFSSIAGGQILLPLGKRREILLAELHGLAATVLALCLFLPLWQEKGAAAAFVLAMASKTAYQYWQILHQFPNLRSWRVVADKLRN